MLTHIAIKNFTIIEQLELDLHDGMTVVTGETGVGKSIILDALALCLGARADSRFLRPGSEQCDISANFTIEKLPQIKTWLAEHELLADESECIMRRVIQKNGRSRCYINQQNVPLQLSQSFASHIVELHSQHQQQLLLKKETQRELLDDYGEHKALRLELHKIHEQYHAAKQQLERLQSMGNNQAERDLLRYQVAELEQLNLTTDEVQKLEAEHTQLSHADQLLQDFQQVLDLTIDGEHALNSQIHHVQQLIINIAKLLPQASNSQDLLQQASIFIHEACEDLRALHQTVEHDPARLQQVEQRLDLIHNLARKHHVSAKVLIEHFETLNEQLTQLEQNDKPIAELEKDLKELAKTYQKIAEKLHKKRCKTAEQLSDLVSKQLPLLGMPHGLFSINVDYTKDHFYSHGSDTIEFMVSLNPGQSAQPLAKAASGGELSRISLAIYVLTASKQAIPTLIFDEIDVGIGGNIAAVVGELLQQLAKSTQILCITHQPQVAAYGKQHLLVEKEVKNNETYSKITELNNKQKINEIARMLGGKTVTAQTKAHAKELCSVSN